MEPIFASKSLDYDYIAPDSSILRLLVDGVKGGLSHCILPPHQTSNAVKHKTVEEIWYFISGNGEMYQERNGIKLLKKVTSGDSITIPVGNSFQFRNTGNTALKFIVCTMPLWPGEEEAIDVGPLFDNALSAITNGSGNLSNVSNEEFTKTDYMKSKIDWKDLKENRKYTQNPLPLLNNSSDKNSIENKKEDLWKLYELIFDNWKMLVDIRFKLLAFIPAVSILAIKEINELNSISVLIKLILSSIGLVAAICILIYEMRNTQLHDDLISRGRKIEMEIGFDTGMFLGRLSTHPSYKFIKHDIAINIIYGVCILSWLLYIVILITL